MAKGNLFLGHAKGKVGSVVFSRAFGQQITRTKPTSVANPKTIGQNTQRAILATIAKSAAAMTQLVDHSFANVTYGAESVRHFRKINMGLLRNLYLNTQNGANLSAKGGSFVPNPLKVSEGSLSSFFAVVNGNDVAFKMNSTSSLPATGDITVSQFLNVYPALQGGDQITLVKLIKANDGKLIDGDALLTMTLDRIVFSPNAFEDPDATIISEGDGVIGDTFLDLTKTTDKLCLSKNTEGGLGFSSDGDVYYAALILSRKVNNVWQRSTQYLEQVDFNDHTNNEFAIESYGASASISEATEYLNQAEEGESHSGSSGPYMNATTRAGSSDPNTDMVLAGRTESASIEADAGTKVILSAVGFDANEAGRLPFFTIYKGAVQQKVHSGSISHSVVVSAQTAGIWKIEAVFADRSVATYEVTLSVKP